MIIEREKILDRWSEYIIKELMEDERKGIGVMKDNFPGPTNVDNKYTITEVSRDSQDEILEENGGEP